MVAIDTVGPPDIVEREELVVLAGRSAVVQPDWRDRPGPSQLREVAEAISDS